MKQQAVLLSGASGFIGSALSTFLTSQNYTVYSLVRREALSPFEIQWNPETGELPLDLIEGMEACINLNGASISAKRWSESRKKTLNNSRIQPTQTLAKAFNNLKAPPKVFISMSGAGIYSSNSSMPDAISESGPHGSGFLHDLVTRWELAAQSATNTRVVLLRTAVVLSHLGGALPKLQKAVQFACAGRIGSGKQKFPWISLYDLCSLILFCIKHDEISGPINAVAPNLMTQEEVMKAIGHIVHRPSFVPCPGFLAHILLGQMADECLVQGQNIIPAKALNNGFTFSFPQLIPFLKRELIKLN